MSDSREPRIDARVGDSLVTLLGTAHVSRASAEQVASLLADNDYDAVAVELCPSRYNALIDPDALARMDLISVVREKRVYMAVASLVLSAYQQRLADQFGIEPGAEQRAAIRVARERHLPVMLVDREIGVTLRRVSASLSWWKRITLFSGILGSLISREQVSEAEIERLKEGDVLETTFAELATNRGDLYVPLIDERDRYIAARLREEVSRGGHRRVLAVLGAGHLRGVARYLAEDGRDPAAEIAELDRQPRPARWPQVIPWAILALVLAGFGWGFTQSPRLGWEMVVDWVLITGGLCAVGTALAGAHPLTVVAGLLAAPLTTLHPAIGAGMVTGVVEVWLRRPNVGDFGRLRQDTAEFKGWWRNRVSRTLMVFTLSSLGAAAGTYVAGFRIAERVFG